MRIRRSLHPSTFAAIGVYLLLFLAAFFEQFGKTTNDTKTPLIESPDQFLHSALRLWNPMVSLGELQNQAYGYLFPQGPFYLFAQLVHVPPWASERVWSTLVLVVGCEGARRVARAIGFSPWAAWVAGMAYGLNPRVISQVGVRSGEILPGAVLPWVLLPVVLTLTGRLSPRRGALFSVVAFMFSGSVNGTAAAAPLLLVVIVMVWGIRRGLASWSMLGWWSGLLVLTSIWWVASLLKLNSYSPPFFDYVEDARATTGTTGYSAAIRGASNWVNYMYTGDHPTWPAGLELSYTPWLVLASGLLATVGVLGLVLLPGPWRAPLVVATCVGVGCLTVGHASSLGSPLHPLIQDYLDGPLALLRNVHKVDPVVRLPIALGVGSAFTFVAARAGAAHRREGRLGRWPAVIGGATIVALALSSAQPAIALNLRTPGWDRVPDYWHQTAEYLEEAPGDAKAWIIPGSGFGVQTWGWTMDEPMSSVASTPWVTRSQVPLAPPETIRVLSRLEEYLASGAGSPNLGRMLARLGIGYVIVRNDLDPTLAEATSVSLVSIAMARSEGVTRRVSFGALDFGPAIEVFSVDETPAPDLSLASEAGAATVAGASSDVIDAVGQGLIETGQASIVQGDDGWDLPAQVVGDAYRLRERNFGRVHDSEGPTLARGEPLHGDRVVANYPGNPGSEPVTTRYEGIAYVTASSSQGFTNELGQVRPENAPYAAVDDDPLSGWRSGYFQSPSGEWLEVRLDGKRDIGELTVTSTISNALVGEVLAWRIEAGDVTRRIAVDPFTGVARTDLSGVRADRVRLTVIKVRDARSAPVSVLDVSFSGLPADRTLVVPVSDTTADADFVFTARPEVRTCITTLIAPDCSYSRGRLSDESQGIDRTFSVSSDGTWQIRGTVIARARTMTHTLLDPIGSPAVVHASSTLAADPTVSARMAYDGSLATSWMADPYDPEPTLVVEFATRTEVDQIGVAQPAQPAVTPTEAVLRSGSQVRTVDLGDFGQFEPMRVKRLEITLRNPTRGLSPVGLSELYVGPESIAEPFDGSTGTGAVCGFGPRVEIDGDRYATAITGFMGNVVSAGPLQMSVCDDGRDGVELDAGEHRIRIMSTEQFQPVITELASTRSDEREVVGERGFRVVTDRASQQTVEVGPGEPALIVTTRNFNRGWVAKLDGDTLPVQRVDGWAQGWRVPAGEGGTIEIVFAPERSYVVVLIAGLAVSLLTLLLAIVLMFRTRLEPERPIPERAPRQRRRSRVRRLLGWSLVVVAPVGVWLIGGVPALGGLLIAAGLGIGGRTKATVVLAGILMAAGPILVALCLHLERAAPQPAADVLTGLGFALAVASTIPWPRQQRPVHG